MAIITFAPKLPGRFFTEDGVASWTFMSSCNVIYKNLDRKNTYGSDAAAIKNMTLITTEGQQINVTGDTLRGKQAEDLRNGRFVRIIAEMN